MRRADNPGFAFLVADLLAVLARLLYIEDKTAIRHQDDASRGSLPMYTIVLMTAMTAGSGATDWGPKVYLGSGGCACNCSGYDPAIRGWPGYGSYPYGGYTNCWGGCSGWYPGGFVVTPGAIPRPDAPTPKTPAPPPSILPSVSAPAPSTAPAAAAVPAPAKILIDRARLIVEVPANAKVFLNDQPTRSTSTVRSYLTPPLQTDETYFYVVRIETEIDGAPVSQTKRILLHVGEEVRTRFSPDGPLTVQAP